MPGISETQRLNTLETLHKLVNHFISEYKRNKTHGGKQWITRKAKIAIERLEEIAERITEDLQIQKVRAFCQPMPDIPPMTIAEFETNETEATKSINNYLSEILTQTNPMFTLFEIARLAPAQNILHDISWLTDGSIGDFIDVGLGIKEVNFFEAFLPDKIEQVSSHVIPFLKGKPEFKEKADLVESAIKLSNEENYLASNILLIIATESIAREFCKFVYHHQNSNSSPEQTENFVNRKFPSLADLLQNGNWEDDYPLSLSQALVSFADVSEKTLDQCRSKYRQHKRASKDMEKTIENLLQLLEKAKEMNDASLDSQITKHLEKLEHCSEKLLSENDNNVKVNLSVMLNFLIRKYKDDRNALIHGNFQTLNHKWKNYINYSALLKLFEVFKQYQVLYNAEA